MLKFLEYAVSFPTTGRSFQNRIEFAPGLTAITGRNEAGKTLNIEMIGYCLFGKDALRGLASDYKNLTATLSLEILGKDVLIERAKKETLIVDGNVEAVGAAAINQAVPALLGFGMDVFNIACAAQQGDLDALTKMRPTERRAMIDRLIGIDVLEGIEKECRAEAKAAETVAQSLILSVSPPQKPVQPDDYQPSADLEQLLVQVQAHEDERKKLLAVPEPVAPVAPTDPQLGSVADLEAHEAQRQLVLQTKARLEGRLAGMPEATVSRDVLEKALVYKEHQDEVRRRGAQPEHPEEDLDHWEWIWGEKGKLTAEPVNCPKCQHHFIPDVDVDVAAIEALPHPPLLPREITTQKRRWELWAEPLAEVEAVELPNIQQEILAHAHIDDRAAILDELGRLVVPVDQSGALRSARSYQQELAIYAERAARYDQDMAAFRDARARLGGMADRQAELEKLRQGIASARTFENQLERYEREVEHYLRVRGNSDIQHARAEGFKLGAGSLRTARSRVKQELAPSLASAGSTLLSAMTNGERRRIEVDEDFNILVDGQALQTLSGSGKSVVNLALRIGLGQVLTSKVLPIFLGDEIDKDMDGERASATHGTLQNLRQYLTQIIIVTHKPDFEADNTINLDTVSA